MIKTDTKIKTSNIKNASPDVSVVIVSFNTRELTRECIEAFEREAAGVNYEIIVVDNDSKDDSAAMIESEFPHVHLIKSDVNLGFAGGNNRGFAVAKGRYILLLNTDAFLKPNALQTALIKMDADEEIGLGGARLIGRDDSPQPSARMFPSPVNDFLILSGLSDRFPKSKFFGRPDRTWADENESAEVDWVPGAFALIRRDALEKIGYFDEDFFLYYEEVDLCRRLKNAGYKVLYWADVCCIHIGGESSKTLTHLSLSKSGSQLTLWRVRSAMLYYRKHHGALGAWIACQIEKNWHALRAFKNSLRAPENEKTDASKAMIETIERAWRETNGGKISPARPW